MTSAVPRVLLDTSVLIEPPAAGFASLAQQSAVSAVAVAELEYGVGAALDPMEQHLRRERLQRVLSELDVLPFDRAAAAAYGLLTNLVRAAGRNPRPRRIDLMIAASAVRHELPLATRNADDLRHLERALVVIAVS
jgi:toxin FitB